MIQSYSDKKGKNNKLLSNENDCKWLMLGLILLVI